jgi:hypothetical protein
MSRDQRTRRLTGEAARLLTLATEPWLSCEDCFRLLDSHIEALLAGHAGGHHRAMAVHLAGCAACAEEAQSLLLFVAGRDGVDPAPALRRLGQAAD